MAFHAGLFVKRHQLIEQELKHNTLMEKQINDGVRQVHNCKGV
jgi:hypothetical protein